MAYDRYTRNDDRSQGGRYRTEDRWNNRDDRGDRDRGSFGGGGGSYGYGGSSWQGEDRAGRDNYGQSRDYYGGRQDERGDRYGGSHGSDRNYGDRGYGTRDQSRGSSQGGNYRGSYASDGHRFTDYRPNDRDDNRSRDDYRGRERNDRLEYDSDDRGFLARAGDEVRSWFGDEEAERRRERDQRYDEQMARYDDRHSDHAYRSWRDTQVSAFDRDYDEYRQENSARFQNEFSAFRTERQSQRDSLTRVQEHQEVVGSDGEHVGTVDKVRGDRIILTRTDVDAGGHHHSIPSRWVQTVDDKVTLRKTKAEAQGAWRDEEQQQALFNDRGQSQQHGYGNDRFGSGGNDSDRNRYGASATTGQALNAGTSTTAGTGISGGTGTTTTGSGDTNLNRSFSGTY